MIRSTLSASLSAFVALVTPTLSACTVEHSGLAHAPQAIVAPVAFGGNAPTLVYSFIRPLENATYPRIPALTLRLHDAATIDHVEADLPVKYQLTYQPLSNASGVASVTPIELVGPLPFPLIDPVIGPVIEPRPTLFPSLRVDPNGPTRGFVARSVYRLKIQLFDIANAPLGPPSDWFYSVTGGTTTDPSGTLQGGRIDIVLRALDQLGDAQAGLIGAGGTLEPDGTRFVSEDHPNYNPGDELTGWCDWFYRYVGVVATDGLDGHRESDPVVDGGNLFWNQTVNPNNIPNGFRDPLDDGCGTERVDLDNNNVVGDILYAGCQEHSSAEVTLDTDDNRFHSNKVGNIYYDATKSLPQNQGMGNYQAMDFHAGMFLAFDPDGDGTASGAGATGTVWSIEGNVSNTVKVMHRAANSTTINGFGKLTATMFEP